MNQRQRRCRLNKSRRNDSRPPWMKLKHVSPKIIMDGNIGNIQSISFIESPPCNELKEFLEATKQTITDALGIPAHFLKEPEL